MPTFPNGEGVGPVLVVIFVRGYLSPHLVAVLAEPFPINGLIWAARALFNPLLLALFGPPLYLHRLLLFCLYCQLELL